VAAVCYWLSRPVPGLGIAEPVFVPSVTTAIVALLLSREHAAPLAYIGGSLGTLIGADLLNLGNLRGLGAPVVSIGGAGTFDGIFLIGIVAGLIASPPQVWSRRWHRPGEAACPGAVVARADPTEVEAERFRRAADCVDKKSEIKLDFSAAAGAASQARSPRRLAERFAQDDRRCASPSVEGGNAGLAMG